MIDPGEQESQPPQESVEFVSPASSQGTGSATTLRTESNDSTKIANGFNLDHESMKSLVDETQFENLEPDTQAPESLRSHVDETQYVNLELDSQAPNHTTLATTKDNLVPHNALIPAPQAAKNDSFATIVRPVIDNTNDISTMFKFGKANRPIVGQFNAKISHKKTGVRDDRITAASLPSGHCSLLNPTATAIGKSSSSSNRSLNTACGIDESIQPQGPQQPSHSMSRTPVGSKQSTSISNASERTNPIPRPQSLHYLSSSSATTLMTNLDQQERPAAEDSNNNWSFHTCQQDLEVNSSSGPIPESTHRQNQSVPDVVNTHTSRSIPPLQHTDQPPDPSHKTILLPFNKVSTYQDAPTSACIAGEDAVPQLGLVSTPRVLMNIPSSNQGRPTSFVQQIPKLPSPTHSVLDLSDTKPSGSKPPRRKSSRRSSGRVKPCGFPGRISLRTPKTAVRPTIKHPFPDVHIENRAQVTHDNTNDVNTTREINDTHAQSHFLEHDLKTNPDVRIPKRLTEDFDAGVQNSVTISRPHRDTSRAPFGSEVAQQVVIESPSRDGSQCSALDHTGSVRSRPPSRSNMAARMNRSSNLPIQRGDAEETPPVLRSRQSARVSKPCSTTNGRPKTHPALISCTLPGIKSLISTEDNSTVFGQLFERVSEAHSRYISASDEVEAQHERLEKLKVSEETLQKKVQDLETEKSALNQELKKFSELNKRYTKHMNKVVISQNELKQAATLLRNDSSEAIALCNASQLIASEAKTAASGITSALQEIKAMRIDADKAVAEERLVSALRSQIERSSKEHQATIQQLTEVSNEKEGLQTQVDDLKQTNKSLDKTIQSYLMEMQIDKNTAEKLRVKLEEKTMSEKALAELITNIPKEISKEFTKDNGMLAKILGADVVTQAKLEEISGCIKELKDFEAKPTATLVELIKSLSDRIPGPQPQEDMEAPKEQFISKLFDNLKTWLNQFSLKSQIHVDLENQISELQKSNRDLELNIKDDENKKKDLELQMRVAERDLSDCRKQLESKSQELVAAIAAPKEDPQLLRRILELENSKSEMCKQLETSSTKVAILEQENTTLEEAIATAETKINTLEQNQVWLVARHKEETQKTAALAEKNMTENDTKKDSQLNNLRKTLVAKEADLKKANDELKQAIGEVQLLKSNNVHEQREAFFGLVELRKSFDHDARTGTEERAIYLIEERLKEVTSKIESAREGAASIGALAAAQAELDSKLKKNEAANDLLKKEVAELKVENSKLLMLHSRNRQCSSPTTFAEPSLSTFDKEVTVTQSVLGSPEDTLQNNTTSKRASLREIADIPESQEPLNSASQQPRKLRHGITENDASLYFNSNRKAIIKNPKKGQAKDLTMMFQESAKVQRETRLIQASSVQSKSARLATSSHSTAHPSSEANSRRSSTSSFTDLSMAWDTMDGREVDKGREKRRREKHEALTKPAQSVASQWQKPFAGAVLLPSESHISQHLDVTAIFPTKKRREPSHRQPQADLKSAMKPTSATAHMERINSPKNAVVLAQPLRRSMPLQEKSTAQGVNKGRMATTRHQPPYNRMAGSLPARDEDAVDKTHNTVKALSKNSPVHNGGALRRSISWKGFGSNNKRTAEAEAEPSKPAKAPRMSYAPGHGSRK